jgi:hypothetical protein
MASTAPLIAFQDSDDEWLPSKLEKGIAALSSAGDDVGVFYSNMIRVEEDGSFSEWKSPDVRRGVLVSERTLDYQVMGIGIQSAIIKRTCVAQVGLFDESLPRFIDLDLFIRLSEHFHFYHHGEALVRYYAGQGISGDPESLVRARRYLIKKYRKRLGVQKHHLAHQYLFLADALRLNGSRNWSRALAVAAVLRSPRESRVRWRAIAALKAPPA